MSKKPFPNTFPGGVDKTTALLDLLASWMDHVYICREIKKIELKRIGKTRVKWEVHQGEDYGNQTVDLYQATGLIMLLPGAKQDAARQNFMIEYNLGLANLPNCVKL
jgi:hypothetical protein